MKTRLPPLRERPLVRFAELGGVWLPPLVVAGLFLFFRELERTRPDEALQARASLSLLACFFQPVWLGIPWLIRLWGRAQALAGLGRREELHLASVPAEDYLRRALAPAIRRCILGFFAATAIWFPFWYPVFVGQFRAPTTPPPSDIAVLLLFLVPIAEQFAALGLTLLGAAELMARRLRPGETASSLTLVEGLFALALFAGPLTFFAFGVWLVLEFGGTGILALSATAWGFAALAIGAAFVRRARVLENFYRFE